jgi:hypothetical protein
MDVEMPSIHFASEPFHSKLFMLYLLIVYGTAVVCSLKLAWSLSSFAARKRIPVRSIVDGEVSADVLARLAFSNRISAESVSEEGLDSSTVLPPTREKASLRTLQVAEGRFLYLLGIRQFEVAIMNRLARLTLLLSFLVVAYGASWTWADQFDDNKITGGLALVFTAHLLLWRLALGIFASAVLYAISSIFDLVLTQRLNSWRYLYSRVVHCSAHEADSKQPAS